MVSDPVSLKAPRRWRLSAFVWLALGVAASATIVVGLPELRKVIDVAQGGDPLLLGVLLGLECIFLLDMGLFYWSTFRATGLHARPGRFLLLAAAGHFVNLVSKSSGFGALALYINEGKRRGDSPLRVTLAYLIAYALGYAAFFAVLLIALVVLYRRGSLTLAEEIGAGAIGVVVIFGVVLTAGVLFSRRGLGMIYRGVAWPLDRARALLGHAPSSTGRDEAIAELQEAVDFVRSRPAAFIAPFGFALGIELLSAVMLLVAAASLHADVSFATALVAYALSLMFAILSVTPAGLGFVEVSLTLFLVSSGLSRQSALAVTLGYRLFDFWLPVIVGMLTLLALKAGDRRDDQRV